MRRGARGSASGLRKGHCPLTLFLRPGLSALPLLLFYAAFYAFAVVPSKISSPCSSWN